MSDLNQEIAEARFASLFAHFGAVTAYLHRRGSRDPEALAADVMLIAWRRLADVPVNDARPWLYVTARNLLHAERRASAQRVTPVTDTPERGVDANYPSLGHDPHVAGALQALSACDREALLLVSWDDLTPTQTAAVVGISATAFRMRLLRARRRFQREFRRTEARKRPFPIPEPH